jgi:hypothetical protein
MHHQSRTLPLSLLHPSLFELSSQLRALLLRFEQTFEAAGKLLMTRCNNPAKVSDEWPSIISIPPDFSYEWSGTSAAGAHELIQQFSQPGLRNGATLARPLDVGQIVCLFSAEWQQAAARKAPDPNDKGRFCVIGDRFQIIAFQHKIA